MKILRWIIIVLIALVAAFFIFSAAQPNTLVVEEKIKIDSPIDLVYQELLNFNNWNQWLSYNRIDSNLKSNISGGVGEIASSYKWKSENPVVGEGERVLVEKQENEYLKHQVLLDGWPNNSIDEFNLQKTPNRTILIRRYKGAKTPFYLNFLNTFMEPMVKNNIKKDLKNFKIYLENIEAQKVPNPQGLVIRSFEGFKFISIKDSCKEDHLPKTLSNLYTKLSIYLDLNDNAEETGSPIAIYHKRLPSKIVVEAALPFKGEIAASDQITIDSLPASKVIRGKYYGQHQMSSEIYDAIITYANAKSLVLNGSPWEAYTAMGANNKNTEALIYYPLKAKD